jgi:tight adherence protein B
MNNHFFVIAMILLFIAVFVSIEGLYLWWNAHRGPEAAHLAKRLRMISAGGAVESGEESLLKRRLSSNSPSFERMLMLWPRLKHIDRLLVQSGSDWTLPNFATYTGGMFVAAFFATLLLGHTLLVGLMSGLILATFPLFYLMRLRANRLKRFESLLPETLDLMGRALRAGHSLSGSLQMAGTEMPDPVGEEFRQVVDEINFGIAAQDALQNLARRVPSTDLGFFVVAVLIQRETGGNLSEILSNISNIIRERLKLFGKVRALSAEGRYSGLVLSLLPFVTGFMIYLIDPSFVSALWTDPAGIFLSKLGIFLMIVGAFWMRRIVRIHV